MTNIPDDVRIEANRVVRLTESLALGLSQRASQRLLLKRVVELASLIAGLAALGISLSPDARELLGDAVTRMVVSVSGLTLIATVVVDRIFKDPAERFSDYSFYIGSYESAIKEVLLDHEDSNSVRRLREVIRMAEKNINDVRKNWPDLYERYSVGAAR